MDKPTHSATEYFDFAVQLMGREDWASATQMFRAAVQLDLSLAHAYARLELRLEIKGCGPTGGRARSKIPNATRNMAVLAVLPR
jgi:hypothetical protein